MNTDAKYPISQELPRKYSTWQQAYEEASAHPEWKDASLYITYWDRSGWLPGPVSYAKAFIEAQSQKEANSASERLKQA